MVPQRPIGCGGMDITPAWMPRVALLTILAVLLTAFAWPPVQPTGLSITKASPADTDAAAVEHTARDAEEDAAGENELDNLVAVDPTATIADLFSLASLRGRSMAQAAWPAAGRQHGPDSVRGPPA